MNNYVESILTKFRTWKESKVHKQPLSQENAYSIYAIGKTKTLPELYTNFFESVIYKIKEHAKYTTEVLIKYPEYLCTAHKEKTVSDLKELGYPILFNNEDLILISWKLK